MRALLKRTHSKIQRLVDEEEEPTSESLEKMTTLLASEDDIQNGITEILMSGIRRYTGGGKLLSNGTHVAIVSEGRVLGVTELTSDPHEDVERLYEWMVFLYTRRGRALWLTSPQVSDESVL